MGQIEWSIKNGQLVMWLSWEQENETSTGTSGTATCYSEPLTDLEVTAKALLKKVGSTYNLRNFNGVADWSKLA